MGATDPGFRPNLAGDHARDARDNRSLRALAIAARSPGLSFDDIQELVRLRGELPGGGLHQPEASCNVGSVDDTGVNLVGSNAASPYRIQIRCDGYVTAANERGELHWHAAAVAEELRWHDRLRYRVLHSALRPAGSMLVDLARLAEVASSVPGCTVKFEARPVPNTLQLVFARYGARASKVVVDISTAGHMRARIRRRNRDGGQGRFSGSKPEVAEKVLAQLLRGQAAMSVDAADVAADFGANYLFTSSVLT